MSPHSHLHLTSGWPRLVLLALVLTLLIGLQLRLTTVIGTDVDVPLRADAGQYFAYAYNLRNHAVYSADLRGVGNPAAPAPRPDDVRNPGYPLLLLPFIGSHPTDASLLRVTLFQAFLSAGVIYLIYLAACSTMSRPAAVAVAFLTAVSPHLINANVYILTETAASFTTVLFLFSLIHFGTHSERTGVAGWLVCGALLAIATLVRPTMQWFLIPTLFLIHLLPNKEKRQPLLAVLTGFAVIMAPWWVRNLIQFGELSNPALLIATLHHGMYPDFMYAQQPDTFGFPYRFDPRSAEIANSLGAVLTEIARRFMEQPKEHLDWFLIGKPLMFWNWDNHAQGAGDVFIYPVTKTPFLTNLPLFVTHEAMRWLHWPLVALGMGGAIFSWLPVTPRLLGRPPTWALRASGTLLLYFVLLHILGAPFPRYAIPLLPVLYLLAGGMLTLAYRLVKRGRSGLDTAPIGS